MKSLVSGGTNCGEGRTFERSKRGDEILSIVMMRMLAYVRTRRSRLSSAEVTHAFAPRELMGLAVLVGAGPVAFFAIRAVAVNGLEC